MPHSIPPRLIISGRLKPCQIDRLYSGMSLPSTLCAALASIGPTVAAGAMPTARQATTSTATGSFMNSGGSWISRVTSRGPWPKKVSWTKRRL